jgi:hypothetical protein
MRTSQDLYKDFKFKQHDWQCKELSEVDITYVIANLLKDKFVVEINGSKYDLSFGISNKDEIGWSYSAYPSSNFLSYEVLEYAFRNGNWFVVADRLK